MIKIRRSRKLESDSRYFNGYTDNTVPDVPYGTGGIPQYNPMVVNDRIELMNDVIRKLEDYWYSEDPKLEDEITRTTKREEVLYIKDISWELDNPDVVTVKFGLAAFDGSNDRVAETREIEINFENFLGHDIEGSLVIFISKKIKSLLDSVLHGGLYKENKDMIQLKRNRMNESCSRYYESLSNSDAERIMDNLREQNTSNKLDSGNFRWAAALNLFQHLLDEKDKGYPFNSDLDVFRKFKKAGYDSAEDLINELTGAVNRRIRELTQVKSDLEGLKQIAISFDIKPGHH